VKNVQNVAKFAVAMHTMFSKPERILSMNILIINGSPKGDKSNT
jgi:hypothetical protein